jgi:hypothetical protein
MPGGDSLATCTEYAAGWRCLLTYLRYVTYLILDGLYRLGLAAWIYVVTVFSRLRRYMCVTMFECRFGHFLHPRGGGLGPHVTPPNQRQISQAQPRDRFKGERRCLA